MNIFYGIAFLVIVYYLVQWKNINDLMHKKISAQHTQIDNKIQAKLAGQIASDSSLIEGFTTDPDKLLMRLVESPDSVRNNCNSMFLSAAYKGVYKNEISEDLFNYSSMKRKINL